MAFPLQNRIDPFGRFVAVPARGTLMGNRGGRLHCDDRTLGKRRWVSRRWICCVLSFKGRQRQVWGQGYTEFFFLDEVVALAAGHRPCAECRRGAFNAYRQAAGMAWADDIDRILHGERLGRRVPVSSDPDGLPVGAMIAVEGDAFAKVNTTDYARFSPEGWHLTSLPSGDRRLLTPPLSLKALAGGYRPLWHGSARG